MGNVFRKSFRILGSDKRKGGWVVEQDVHGNFCSMLHGLLHFCPVSLTELCSFWHGLKDSFTLHKVVDKVVLDH